MRRGFSAVALATATAVLGGLVGAAPAFAEEPGDNPTNPYERTLRISLGAQARMDRCQVARAVHFGGPEMKTYAAGKLAGPDTGLRPVVANWTLGELGDAHRRDLDAGLADWKTYRDRQDTLNTVNKPYASVNSSGGRGTGHRGLTLNVFDRGGGQPMWRPYALRVRSASIVPMGRVSRTIPGAHGWRRVGQPPSPR